MTATNGANNSGPLHNDMSRPCHLRILRLSKIMRNYEVGCYGAQTIAVITIASPAVAKFRLSVRSHGTPMA